MTKLTIVDGVAVTTLAELKTAPVKTKGNVLVLLKGAEETKSQKGFPYVKATVCDHTGSTTLMLFDDGVKGLALSLADKEWPVVLVTIEVGTYRDAPSLNVQEMASKARTGTPPDDVLGWLLEKSPIPLAQLNLEFGVHLNSLREDLREIVKACLVRFPGFDVWPAASSAHHDYVHGLKEHTVRMLRLVSSLSKLYPVDKDVLVAATILHDAAKTREYKGPGRTGKTPVGELVGHISQSANVFALEAERALEKLREENPQYEGGIPESIYDDPTYLNVLHCILSHHGQLEYGSPVSPLTPEAVLLHSIDTLDAQQCAVTKHTKDLKPWTYSADKLATMDFRKAIMLTPKTDAKPN